ncbi:mg386 protein [Tupanvirus deep ocean]|uniref:Mg386 protein n=2 Tax=Tupanvirus TaxID=2094720 RepID=A0AC62A7R4_9VIRU|nr:mg386 protein [Tupanvirus deep ocean]QKU33801.1 mg386 protein [Tupanvirus deep ocean]
MEVDNNIVVIIGNEDKEIFYEIFNTLLIMGYDKCLLTFLPSDKCSTGGIRLTETTKDKNFLTKLLITPDKFYKFICNVRCTIEIELDSFLECLKNEIDNDNPMTIFSDIETQKFYLNSYKCAIGEIRNDKYMNYPIPRTVFTHKMILDANILCDLHKKLTVDGSKFLNICAKDNYITLSNEKGIFETLTDESFSISGETDDPVDIIYKSKYFTLLTNIPKMTNCVEFYVKNDFPLVILVNNILGNIYFFITPFDA